MGIQVFLHRAQTWAKKSMLVSLDGLYEIGVRAFELDVMCKTDGSVCFGHPLRTEAWYDESSHELSQWAIRRDVTVLLDLKQPAAWHPSETTVARFFRSISPDHFLVASYNVGTVTRLGEHFGLKVCNISDALPVDITSNVALILPESVAVQLPAYHRDGQVIVSGIKFALEIKDLASKGFSRFITDSLDIAASPSAFF